MKTKVLDKMFRVLECAVTHSPKPVLLPELVSISGLNKQTCARLVADLVELGYLEHAGQTGPLRTGSPADCRAVCQKSRRTARNIHHIFPDVQRTALQSA